MSSSQSQRCVFSGFQRHQQSLTLPLLMFLLISSSAHFGTLAIASGRPSYKEADQKTRFEIRAHVIGSMPPRCQFRCSGCGPCEAVQIPVTPEIDNNNNGGRGTSHIYETKEMEYSRGDDVTNYKPMEWKCKCGNLIFNP